MTKPLVTEKILKKRYIFLLKSCYTLYIICLALLKMSFGECYVL